MVILAFSIFRIRKYSKLLVESKIFANECLMILHLTSFAVYTLLFTIVSWLNILAYEKVYPDKDIEDEHVLR